ncbi:MAG: leucine dehydrogenase [Chloroflexota bacterium]|nr:leucine dehydrogenase [Chloroflexota bacterium]
MEGLLFNFMQRDDFENLYFCQEKTSGLKAVIAIHNTTLGPAAGGIRMWTYATEEEAIADALQLARAMTYKWAAAGVNLGGGKCVVIGNPKQEKTEALLRRLGRFIQRLNGVFLAGADVGTNLHDMEIIAQESSFIVPASDAMGGAGNSAPATAFGVMQGIHACLNALYANSDLQGRSVAVQGVGAVGKSMVERLVQAGAIVTVTDIDQERVEQVATDYGVQTIPPEEIAALPVDVYCPCALGGVLNDVTIPKLQCKIVCGSANNQLTEKRHGDMLEQRGILYAPDYIVNAGGALWSVDSFNTGGFNRQRAEATVAQIYETTTELIEIARKQGISTARAADVLAEQRIAAVHRKSYIHGDI